MDDEYQHKEASEPQRVSQVKDHELFESGELLRLLIQSARDFVIFTIDPNGIVTTWNSGAELVFGYSAQEIVGRSGDIFFTPEDVEKQVPAAERQIAEAHGAAENERWHVRKDGSRFFGSGMVHPVRNPSGVLIGYVKIMRDLTEKKLWEEKLLQSEERLRITLDSAIDYSIITCDTERKIVAWSKGAEMIFGYKEQEVLGNTADIIFVPEDREMGVPDQEVEEALRRGKSLDERWHLRNDGSRVFMSGVMAPLKSGDKLAGFVKVARDLTESKLREQQKDEFIGIASHELKTPVTSIKVYTELLASDMNDSDDKANREIVQKLDAQVDRLIQLIHSLLDTTRISEGRLALQYSKFDLNAMIEECVASLQHLSSHHRIIFAQGDLKTLNADRERITQVVTNLITNAIRYSPQGGEVLISTSHMNDHAQIKVEDHGVGIPVDLQERVFERFFRINNALETTSAGMGLGLYVSNGIVERHGGTLKVDSEVGKGSVFQVNLPYTPPGGQEG